MMLKCFLNTEFLCRFMKKLSKTLFLFSERSLQAIERAFERRALYFNVLTTLMIPGFNNLAVMSAQIVCFKAATCRAEANTINRLLCVILSTQQDLFQIGKRGLIKVSYDLAPQATWHAKSFISGNFSTVCFDGMCAVQNCNKNAF